MNEDTLLSNTLFSNVFDSITTTAPPCEDKPEIAKTNKGNDMTLDQGGLYIKPLTIGFIIHRALDDGNIENLGFSNFNDVMEYLTTNSLLDLSELNITNNM